MTFKNVIIAIIQVVSLLVVTSFLSKETIINKKRIGQLYKKQL